MKQMYVSQAAVQSKKGPMRKAVGNVQAKISLQKNLCLLGMDSPWYPCCTHSQTGLSVNGFQSAVTGTLGQ